jgi:hypothetical protein
VTTRNLAALALTAILALYLPGCSARKHAKAQTPPPDAEAQAAGSEAPESPSPLATPAPPSVTVHIGYAHRNDHLESLSVAKFAAAVLIRTRRQKSGTAAVLRFEGGEPVWEIAADKGLSGSLLGHVPGVGEYKKFAIGEVTYGVLPKHFSKAAPENSEPEPLERGSYYIFTVRRKIGAVSYQAIHITGDGTIEGYEAQPRAGSSYELCCNIAPDFAGSDTRGEPSAEPQ